MTATFTVEGSRIHDIASFYDEINRVFMVGEDWRLGPSLDALDDMLYGGYGALHGADRAVIVWNDFAFSENSLGQAATREYYRAKLTKPETFNAALFQRKLDELEHGTGQTYFEIVLEIIAMHSNITLERK